MKIAAIFCVALLAYVVVASGSEDGEKAAEESKSKQYYIDNRYRYPQGYYRPQPTPYRPRTTRRRNNIFSNPLYLFLIISILRSSTTTTEKPVDTTVEMTTDVTTPEMTTSKYSGWTVVGTCRYYLVEEVKTADDAKDHCVAIGGALASVGFNTGDAAKRTTLIETMKAKYLSFWVGATGVGDGTSGATTTGTFWFNPSGDSPDTTNSYTVLNADTTNGPVCGRFPANDVTTLFFEACGVGKYFSMCEYCGTIA